MVKYKHFANQVFFRTVESNLNLTPLDEIEEECIAKGIESAEFFGYATHEEYFYPEYFAYQPDYAEKVLKAAEILHKYGYEYFFIEELVK